MINLLELFNTCLTISYEQIGSEVNYAFVEEKDTLYIYFECSASKQDWKANFDFKRVVYDGLFKVHRGFYECYYQVRNIILDKVYSKDWEEVIVIGYSHGSTLCGFATQDIRYHFPNLKLHGYGFESPRFVKVKKELKYMWNDFTVIRNGTDIVTHVPPKIFGFSDVGTMLKIKGDTKLVENKLPKCVKYHFPQCVIDGLEKL